MAKKRAKREPLSRERIEAAALALIEKDGLDEFSTRRLAAELGCEAMSIYHYFPSMAHLKDALVDRCVAEIYLPPATGAWLARLRAVAHGYREAALRHPRFFPFIVTHRLNTPTGLRYLESILQVFHDAGFDTESAARLFRVMGYYIAGASLDESAGYGRGPSAASPVAEDVAAHDYPLVTAVNPWFKPRHHKATFDLGLEMMIDGIAKRAPKRSRPRGKSGNGAAEGAAASA